MLQLENKYKERLDIIAEAIQDSEELALYLEEEEEEYFLKLREIFEPYIAELHEEVALNNPLQIISFEKELLDEKFEGLFLPKILGYSVLRGVYNEKHKYLKPQEHFSDVITAICDSANFDSLKKRIGQAIQIGFAYSSDIWVANLISSFKNKKIRKYLAAQKLRKYGEIDGRRIGHERFMRQFKNEVFMSADFPDDIGSLSVEFPALKQFLEFRIKKNFDNTSVIPFLDDFIRNEKFHGRKEHVIIMGLYAHFFDLEKKEKNNLATVFDKIRKIENFADVWFKFILSLHKIGLHPNKETDNRVLMIIDESVKDDLTLYYEMAKLIHNKGYNNEKVQEAVKEFYFNHGGLSIINKVVRELVFSYFAGFINNLEVDDYEELYEISKNYKPYMDIFANQQFNQDLKDLNLDFAKRVTKSVKDRRSRPFQDVRKFIKTTFIELGMMTDKEVTQFFKRKRKPKPVQ